MSFGGDARSRGTIRLRTLRPPGVKTLKGMFDKKDLDDEHLALADEAQLDPLLNLLTHDHPTVRALVEEAIMNLEKIDDDEIIMNKRGVQALYKLLTFKDPACQRESIWAIAILACISEANHDTIKVDIGWLTIMSLAKHPQLKEEEIQRGAVTCISNLCLNEDNHEMVIKEGGLDLLKNLARTTNDLRIKRPIANAFANLATDEDYVQQVVDGGGLEMMIGFANETDEELVCGAIHTIANLADAEEMKPKVVQAGGLDVIIKLLSSKDATIVKGASNALANLATERDYQTQMIKLGVAEPLTALAKKSKNPEIQLRVALAVNNIVSNPELRDPMRAAGIVRPLRSLARSRNPEIKREAIEALTELGESITGKKKKKTAMAGGMARRGGGGDSDEEEEDEDEEGKGKGAAAPPDPLAGGSISIRVQPVDPANGQKCGVGQIVTIDTLKIDDLTKKVSDTFGKKVNIICQNGVVLEKDEQLYSLKSGDVLDATFSLSVNVQQVDPRTGGPVGEPFPIEMNTCKLNDLKTAVGNKSGRNVARVLHNGQLVGTDDQLHNVRSGEVIEVAYAPVQVRVQPVDPKTGQPNANAFLVQLVAPDIDELTTKCTAAANGQPVLGLSYKGQRLTTSEQLEAVKNGEVIAIAYQQVQAAPPPQPEPPKSIDIFVQPLDPKTGQPFGQAFSVSLDNPSYEELTKKVGEGSGGRPLQALTHRGQIVKGDESLQSLKSGDAIGAVFGRNLKIHPMDAETNQPAGEPFNVTLDSLKLDDLKAVIAQNSGGREVVGVTHNGNPITTDAQLQYMRNGDNVSAVYAPLAREAKQDKTGESGGGGDDWDEEEDDQETDEDKKVKSELALIMMELWEPKGDDRVEDALRRLLFLSQRVRNRKLIRIAGAIPILINMLKSADPSLKLTTCQSIALECLATLSKNILNREEIRKNGGLSPMVSFVHKKEKKDKLEALRCLKECSKSPKNKNLLRKAGFIETLVPYLLPKDEPVQSLVLDVLTVVCFNDPLSQQTFRDAKGIPPVIQLLKCDMLEVRKRAVRTLGAICGNNRKIQGMIRKAKAIEMIVPQLGDKDDEVQKAASGCVASIVENDFNNQNTARKAGAVKLLVGQLNSKNDSVKEQACHALRAMAKDGNAKVQAEVRECGALKTLIDLMKSPSEGVIVHATGALMELARDSNKNSDAICFGGAVPLLVSGLNTNSPVLQYHAEGAIWAIARKNKKRKEAFIKAKAIPPLKTLAQSQNEQVKRGAVWALDVLEK